MPGVVSPPPVGDLVGEGHNGAPFAIVRDEGLRLHEAGHCPRQLRDHGEFVGVGLRVLGPQPVTEDRDHLTDLWAGPAADHADCHSPIRLPSLSVK